MREKGAEVIRYGLRNTPFGPAAVVWSLRGGKPAIGRIVLSGPGAPAAGVVAAVFPGATAASSPLIDDLLGRIERFLRGEDVRFFLREVPLDGCLPFQEAVLRLEHAIPRGRVSTYRLIADRLGRPGAARAVGTALATNPFPVVIPCHRAIRSDGSLGGYQGGLAMKRALLEMEGVRFRDATRVAVSAFFYGDPGTP